MDDSDRASVGGDKGDRETGGRFIEDKSVSVVSGYMFIEAGPEASRAGGGHGPPKIFENSIFGMFNFCRF